jgi:hypothetical protein
MARRRKRKSMCSCSEVRKHFPTLTLTLTLTLTWILGATWVSSARTTRTVIGLQAGQPEGSSPCVRVSSSSGAHQVYYSVGTRVLFPWINRLGHEADRSPPSSAEVMYSSVCSCTSIRLHGVVSVMEHVTFWKGHSISEKWVNEAWRCWRISVLRTSTVSLLWCPPWTAGQRLRQSDHCVRWFSKHL